MSSPKFADNAASRVYIDLIHTRLLQTIICAFSEEMRENSEAFGASEVPAAAELLKLLCERYGISPGVSEQAVRGWYEKYMAIVAPFIDTASERYRTQRPQVLAETFEKLAALAETYPPFDWGEGE